MSRSKGKTTPSVCLGGCCYIILMEEMGAEGAQGPHLSMEPERGFVFDSKD